MPSEGRLSAEADRRAGLLCVGLQDFEHRIV